MKFPIDYERIKIRLLEESDAPGLMKMINGINNRVC